MADNVVPFRRKLPEVYERAEIHFADRDGGDARVFSVPSKDMYWWALILDGITTYSRTFEGCVYFFSDPYGFMNESWARRKRTLEILISRDTLHELVKAAPYTFVPSFQTHLNDADYALIFDNALTVINDDVAIDYELGLFITPSDDPALYKVTYVESPK